MTIKQNLLPLNKYTLKSPYSMTPIGICVHNTANDASAKGEISYMVSNSNQTSFHLAVDDIEVWQGLPLDRNGWHAGDGSNGEGNRKHIGIEICYSKSGGDKFVKAEQNAAQLIANLLKERKWGLDRVKKHQDFSGKYCPHRTLDLGWDRFLDIVKNKMGGLMDYEKLYNEARVARDSHWTNMSKLIKATGLDFNEGNATAKTDEAVQRIIATEKSLKEAKEQVISAQKQADQLTTRLNQANTQLQAEIQAHGETTAKLQAFQNMPINSSAELTKRGRLNGFSETYIVGDITYRDNYTVDGQKEG